MLILQKEKDTFVPNCIFCEIDVNMYYVYIDIGSGFLKIHFVKYFSPDVLSTYKFEIRANQCK